jgi:jumonji domain-containing protein 7
MGHWPALDRWQSDQYIAETLGESTQITVAATPNGYADAVVDDRWFVEPAERQMSVADFIRVMRAELADQGLVDAPDLQRDHLGGDNEIQWRVTRQKYPGIHYVQSQNGNLAGEFALLAKDIPTDIEFATTALGMQV